MSFEENQKTFEGKHPNLRYPTIEHPASPQIIRVPKGQFEIKYQKETEDLVEIVIAEKLLKEKA